MTIHYTDLKALYPQTKKELLEAAVPALNAAMEKFDISTGTRKAAFIAQAGHESAGFSVMVENLNYSVKGLLGVFKKYFPTTDLATAYARKPQKIASRVYANRMGNGNEASGDGWKYRGKGYIQLTGKNNVQQFANAMNMSIEDAIAYLETPDGAAMSAAWFWNERNLNTLADQGKFKEITIKINGGTNGLDDRLKHYQQAKQLFN